MVWANSCVCLRSQLKESPGGDLTPCMEDYMAHIKDIRAKAETSSAKASSSSTIGAVFGGDKASASSTGGALFGAPPARLETPNLSLAASVGNAPIHGGLAFGSKGRASEATPQPEQPDTTPALKKDDVRSNLVCVRVCAWERNDLICEFRERSGGA